MSCCTSSLGWSPKLIRMLLGESSICMIFISLQLIPQPLTLLILVWWSVFCKAFTCFCCNISMQYLQNWDLWVAVSSFYGMPTFAHLIDFIATKRTRKAVGYNLASHWCQCWGNQWCHFHSSSSSWSFGRDSSKYWYFVRAATASSNVPLKILRYGVKCFPEVN